MDPASIVAMLAAAAPGYGASPLPPFAPIRPRDTARTVELIEPEPSPADWFVTREIPEAGPGRVWLGGAMVGSDPVATSPGLDPAAQRYGAAAFSDERAIVRVHTQVISLDPFVPLHQAGLGSLERARIAYLREVGYAGSVRTFVNPGTGRRSEADAVPAAVIRVPRDPRAQVASR
jgi:hypothetical protein